MSFKKNFRLLPLAAAMQVLFVSVGYAADFTVTTGSTLGEKQTLTNGQTGTVLAGGVLTNSGSTDALELGAGTSRLVNSGTVSQTGTGNAIDTIAASPTFTLDNNGLITAVGASTIKLDVNGTYILNNSGTISQTGASGYTVAVDAGVPNVKVNNAVGGVISSTGAGSSATIFMDRAAGSVSIDNQGTIWQKNSGGGTSGTTSRAIVADKNYSSTGNTIINGSATNTAAVIRADSNDALRLGTNVTLTNYGSIYSTGTVNTSSADGAGQYLSGISTQGYTASDGVAINDNRPNVAILNYGTITGPRHGVDGGDPVALSTHLTDLASSSLTGSNAQLMTAPSLTVTSTGPNGVTFDKQLDGTTSSGVKITNPVIINYAGGSLTGNNGSGVGLDGYGVVLNYGNITGNYAGAGNVYKHAVNASTVTVNGQVLSTDTSSNGDGDGVDIDGVSYIYNAGSIRGTGAGGYDSGGRPNGADGIATGGGVIVNKTGATIYGQSTGILIDDGANGTITNIAATARNTGSTTGATARIYNEGTITGERKTAIGLVGDYADLLVNYSTGKIEGGTGAVRVDQLGSTTAAAAVQMGGGNDILINYGTITGKNGKAIDMGDGNDTVKLFGGKVNGTIDGGAGNNTLETAGNHTFASGSLLNIQNVNITSGNTTFDSNQNLAGNLTVNGTLKAASASTMRTITVGGNYTQGANGVLEVGVQGKDQSDKITAAGTATLEDGATIQPVSRGYVANGATYRIVSGSRLNTNSSNLKIANNSSLINYSLVQSGNDLVLNAARPATVTNALPAGRNAVLTRMDDLSRSGNTAIEPLLQAVSDLTSTQQLSDALRQISPDASGAAARATQAVTGSVLSSLADRMDTARGSDVAMVQRGLAAGDDVGRRLWAMGLGAWGEQKENNDTNGYKLTSGGVAAGFEFDRSANGVMGVSLAFNKAKSKGTSSASGNDVRIDNYNLGTYYSHNTDALTFDASLALGYNQYDSDRRVRFSGFDRSVSGDYSGWNISGRVELGLPFQLSPSWKGRWLVGARASQLRTGSYTEKGDASIAQRVDRMTSNSLQSVLGAEVSHVFADQSSLRMRARYLHEFSNTPDVTAGFVAGGASFTMPGVNPPRNSFELGLAYRKVTQQGMTLTFGYDAELKKNYAVHKVTARAMWPF